MSNNITDKLLKMKEKIENSKTEKAKMEGQLEVLKKRLNEEFDCPTIKQAETKLKALSKEITELEGKIETGVSELEENYEWE